MGGGDGFPPGRKLSADELQLVLLALLAEQPAHGYELIRKLEVRSGGFYTPSPGMIYPALTYLEEIGHATVEADGAKKLYRITDAGEAALEEKKAVVDAIFRRMAALNERFEGPSPRIARAMQNLGAAIGLRMRSGPVSADQLDALVNAIDDAARKVEKA